jgi:hypothetical protein
VKRVGSQKTGPVAKRRGPRYTIKGGEQNETQRVGLRLLRRPGEFGRITVRERATGDLTSCTCATPAPLRGRSRARASSGSITTWCRPKTRDGRSRARLTAPAAHAYNLFARVIYSLAPVGAAWRWRGLAYKLTPSPCELSVGRLCPTEQTQHSSDVQSWCKVRRLQRLLARTNRLNRAPILA